MKLFFSKCKPHFDQVYLLDGSRPPNFERKFVEYILYSSSVDYWYYEAMFIDQFLWKDPSRRHLKYKYYPKGGDKYAVQTPRKLYQLLDPPYLKLLEGRNFVVNSYEKT